MGGPKEAEAPYLVGRLRLFFCPVSIGSLFKIKNSLFYITLNWMWLKWSALCTNA